MKTRVLELHRQGLSVTAIARRTGRDPSTILKYIERGVEVPVYGPRQAGRPSKIAPYMEFMRERVTAFPDLTASRLTREIREMGYVGAYAAVKRYLAAIRPEHVRYDPARGGRGLRGVSCPLLSGSSTMTVWIKEGKTNAFEEAQARGDHRQAA